MDEVDVVFRGSSTSLALPLSLAISSSPDGRTRHFPPPLSIQPTSHLSPLNYLPRPFYNLSFTSLYTLSLSVLSL